MRSLFIVNPEAGIKVLQKNVHTLSRLLLQTKTVSENTVFYTQKKDDAYEKAKSLKKNEFDFVVAVGGDGTVNEVVRGIVEGGSEIPLTILGAGTTNDFVNALGMGSGANAMLKIIRDFNVRDVDVGNMNGHLFINVASGGLISEIAHRITNEQKSAIGNLAYYVEGAKELTNIKKLKTARLHYVWDEGEFDEDTFLLIVCNSCQSGGFQKIAPLAKLDDGLLDVCIIKKIGGMDIVPVFNKIQSGAHINDPRVTYFKTRSLFVTKVNENEHFSLDYDGEDGGDMPMRVSSGMQKIKMIVPKTGKAKRLFD